MNENVQILDFELGITIDLSSPPIHNLHALNFLPSGLFSLASTVRNEEIAILTYNKERLKIEPGQLAKSFSMMGIIGADNNLCICCFHWFSVSLCNFLRLIALVDFYQKNNIKQTDVTNNSVRKSIKSYCDEYSKAVCPNIVIWRNKIGAHMAITSPFGNDSQGTLEMSAMNSISHKKLRVYTGSFNWVANNQPAELPEWSVTEEFEKLSSRFWPTFKLPELRPLINKSIGPSGL